MFEIEFYKKENGDSPVDEFLDTLELENRKLYEKTMRAIGLLKEHGNELKAPHSEYLREGIYELRAKQGSSISRTLYFFRKGKIIILTNGFVKKTQKSPPSEIETAIKLKQEYERRNPDG